MREIKFRGFNGEKWLYGDLAINYKTKQATISDDRRWRHPVRFYTVGQYTGLKDATGKEIYEGDIVAGYWDFEEDEWPAVVEWDEVSARFVLSGQNSVIPFNEMGGLEVTIIGNVYDNPELLEAQA